jgi:hypothetical protein
MIDRLIFQSKGYKFDATQKKGFVETMEGGFASCSRRKEDEEEGQE